MLGSLLECESLRPEGDSDIAPGGASCADKRACDFYWSHLFCWQAFAGRFPVSCRSRQKRSASCSAPAIPAKRSCVNFPRGILPIPSIPQWKNSSSNPARTNPLSTHCGVARISCRLRKWRPQRKSWPTRNNVKFSPPNNREHPGRLSRAHPRRRVQPRKLSRSERRG